MFSFNFSDNPESKFYLAVLAACEPGRLNSFTINFGGNEVKVDYTISRIFVTPDEGFDPAEIAYNAIRFVAEQRCVFLSRYDITA